MPSRKRSKGKARKAKAKAKDTQSATVVADTTVVAEDDTRTLRVLRSWFTRQLQDVTICSHDCPPLPRAHVGKELLDAIINKIKNLSAHTEIDRPEISNPEKIQELISERKDILLRGETFEFIAPTLNKYLPKNYKMVTDK